VDEWGAREGGGGASEGKGVSGGKGGAEEWPCACACMLCAELIHSQCKRT
jgi:hypothetical protein